MSARTKRVEQIRNTFRRNVRALELRPGIGQGTAVTRVQLLDGLRCEIEEGPWKLTADMSAKSGGEGAGPNPGILGRAALGSCLAVGYAMWAAHLKIPLTSLEVEVQADYDSRGMYGVDDVAPGYTRIRYVVSIVSDAPEADVLGMLEAAEAHSDYLAVFAQPQEIIREVRLRTPGR